MSRAGIWAVGLCGLLVAGSYVLAQGTAAPKATTGETGGHSFGKKILYVVTRPKDSHSEAGYAVYEQAEVMKLGSPSFLMGKVPDWGVDDPVSKITKGSVVWTPMSEILQITEFETLDKAREFFELAVHAASEAEDDSAP